MITIVTDSTADLTPELIHRHQIVVVPLTVTIDNQSYLDGVTLHTQELFHLVELTEKMPTTAAPGIKSFLEVFNQPGEFVYISVSSTLSATYQNATLAAQELPPGKVFTVDSRNLSNGIALLVMQAVDLRDQGKSVAEIAQAINNAVSKIRTSFVIETMDYLHRGGRCSTMQHLVGSLLKIRLVIEVDHEGKMGVKGKIRGSRKKALDSLILDFQKHLPELNQHRIFIAHTGCDDDAQYLVDQIKKMCSPQEIYITTAGSVIASHCGPDTIGILYSVN